VDEPIKEAAAQTIDEKTNVENDVKAEISTAHAELAAASLTLVQKFEMVFRQIPEEIRAEFEALKAKL
jgi:hypothetical protein